MAGNMCKESKTEAAICTQGSRVYGGWRHQPPVSPASKVLAHASLSPSPKLG